MKLKSPAGFTLIEVIVAALLISGVMALLLSAFVTASHWLRPEENVAYDLGREWFENLYERVRQDGWTDAAGPLWPRDPRDPAYPEQNFDLDGVRYTRAYRVESINADQDRQGIEDYRRVRMTVRWN